MKKWYVGLFLFIVLCVGWTMNPMLSSSMAQAQEVEDKQHVRAYFPSLEMARKAVRSFDALESEYEKGYLIMALSQEEITILTDLGFDIEVLETYDMSAQKSQTTAFAEAQLAGIPSYPCYRTVEETFTSAQSIATNNPTLATWTDVGNSWEKTAGLGGYDMMVLKLTNSNISGAKPKLFITSAIHAREYTTAELCTQFAEYLVDNYGTDADATWILDHHEVHLMLHANPDGRKKAEAGISWRKNTNTNYCSPTSNYRGADLNRNFEFSWGCCGGSSGSECSETYRGPSAASEPETQAVQNYVRSQYVDNRGPNQNDPAPDDTSGIYLDIHAHGRLVLWPWGHTSDVAPNGTQMQTLGRKFAYWNNHSPEQSIGLYATDGTTDGVGYGELGVPSYTFELGTAFFQSCSYFTNTIVPDNMPSLIYAAKVVRTPYMTPAGPDAYNLSLSSGSTSPGVPPGTSVTLTATISDTRYNNSNGTEPTQNISQARYYVDDPHWNGGTAVSMSASDGNFNSKTEGVQATIDTTGWSQGQHIIFVEGRDTNDDWGAIGAIFLYINDGSNTPPEASFTFTTSGLTANFTDTSTDTDGTVVGWSWNFGDSSTGSTDQNPSHTYAAAGTYNVTLTVTDNGGETDSHSANVTVSDTPAYCASSGNSNQYEWIAGVEVGPLNNSSNASGYSDFTSQTANLTAGDSVSVSLSPGFAGSSYSESWKIWIDYNVDGDFEDTGEEVFSGSGSSTVTGSFTVPASAGDTVTRMRVSMRYNNAPPSCGSFDYGEVEDYTVDISGGTVNPPVAAFSASSTSITTGQNITFTDQSTNNPTSWSWTFNGGTPGTSSSQNPTVTYNSAGTYTVSLMVSNSAGSDTETKTDYITVTDQPIEYCTSSGNSNNYEWIAGVQVGPLNNTSGASGYTDYTSQTANLTAGASVNVTLTPGFASGSYTEHWRIWIDYNHDGDFTDSGEEVFAGSGSSNVTGSFNVPSSASGVTTRMRVSMRYNSAPPNCGTFSYGEVEDYTVSIQ